MRDTLNRFPLSLGLALASAFVAGFSSAQSVIIDTPFVTGFEGWTDTFSGTPAGGAQPNWGVLLTGPKTLSESSDGFPASGTTTTGVPASADGAYAPYLMINSADLTPEAYVLSSRIGTYDDDGFGLVFGYQDNDNYFRVGFRNQTNSNLGFRVGTSVQKVVNGVVTQLSTNPAATFPTPNGTLSSVEIDVNGTSYDVKLNGASVATGTDADLQPGNYGVHSWAQRNAGAGNPYWGTSVATVSVASTTLNKTTSFADAIPFEWRSLTMVNEAGVAATGVDDPGNFRQDFRNGSILDDSNGYEWATTNAPNVDFIGPGVVLNEPGMASLTDYQMNVRLQDGDDDGVGLLVRVADDDTFYRVNFSVEPLFTAEATAHQRAPRGMSIQKFANGTWEELFRDDQANPAFLFTLDEPFDVSVNVIGDSIQVSVIDDPEGAATVIDYAPVIDSVDPILAGSVGFTNWGSGAADSGVIYSAYGGGGTPFLIEVPEPSTMVLCTFAVIGLLARRRHRQSAAIQLGN
jgi:hypothetical protein